MKPTHSPLPWRPDGDYSDTAIADAERQWVADVKDHRTVEFIVAAVNSHAKLVEALERVEDSWKRAQELRASAEAQTQSLIHENEWLRAKLCDATGLTREDLAYLESKDR
jgi:hypothetical protein